MEIKKWGFGKRNLSLDRLEDSSEEVNWPERCQRTGTDRLSSIFLDGEPDEERVGITDTLLEAIISEEQPKGQVW